MSTAAAAQCKPRVIVLEFNELSPKLMDAFMKQGVLPNFRRLHADAQVYVTDAEEAAPNLEPWIQWVTAHSGQSHDDHGIHTLGAGHKLETRQIWDLLSDRGFKAWVCGSMNIRYDRPINGAVLPDPWAAGTVPFPDGMFDAYLPFVQRNVQEHTNSRVPLTRRDYLRFFRFMGSHGLSVQTAWAIGSQLFRERLTGKGRWRRATILDRLQFDVFRWYYLKEQPDFSTFFVNSTAHLQHMHWRNMDPGPFEIKPADDEQREYRNAIRYGYEMMDLLVGRFLALADPGTTVVLMSALSQQPCVRYEDIGGKTFYRPRKFEHLLAFAGIGSPHQVAPVMSEQFHVHFDSERAAREATTRLMAFNVDGHRAMLVKQNGASVLAGCRIFHQLDHDVLLHRSDGEPQPFFDLFYQAEGLKSGMHHPDGILWIRHPTRAHCAHVAKVPLRDVAPTLLRMFGVAQPAYMSGTPLPLDGVPGRRQSSPQRNSNIEGAPVDTASVLAAAEHGTIPMAGARVSVVMPVYNAAHTMEHSIRSVLAQSHAELELLLVDDCSQDDSWAVIERMVASDPRVVALRLPRNGGVAEARNAGIAAASGNYIAFLDSDDWWHPRKLEIQLAYLGEAMAKVCYTGYQRVGEDGRPLSTVRPPATVRYTDMLKGNHIGNLTGLYERSIGDARFQRVGHEDYVFWLEMVRRAGWAGCAVHPGPLAFYRVRAGSLSGDKFKAARWQWNIYRQIEGIGWLSACRYFLYYIGNALAKRR